MWQLLNWPRASAEVRVEGVCEVFVAGETVAFLARTSWTSRCKKGCTIGLKRVHGVVL